MPDQAPAISGPAAHVEDTRLSATRVLPVQYERSGTIDPSRNRLAALGMAAAAMGVLLSVTWLLIQLLAISRPDLRDGQFAFEVGVLEALLGPPALVALIAVAVIAHEAVHGLCYWAFTAQRPVFGLRGLYAFAGAPDWYLSRREFVLATLAPLVVITVAGLPLLLTISGVALWAVLVVVAFNAAGSIGDLIAAAWVLTRQPPVLVNDTGVAVTIYQLTRSH